MRSIFFFLFFLFAGHMQITMQGGHHISASIPNVMSQGYRVAVNLNIGEDVGHGFIIDKVIKQTYQKVNGTMSYKTVYNAMKPATGGVTRYSRVFLNNAFLPITAPVLLNVEIAIRNAGMIASPILINR